jgi:hypothetical protein
VVLWWIGLGPVALGARRLALDHCNQVVVATTLVVLLLLFLEARGRPLAVVHDLLPLGLRGVERCCDRFLVVRVVARDVEELLGCTRRATSESVDERGAGRVILER